VAINILNTENLSILSKLYPIKQSAIKDIYPNSNSQLIYLPNVQYKHWCVANLRVGVASISSFSVAAMLGAIILVIVLTELAFVQAVPTT